MISRKQALELLHSHMQNQNLRRHCYSVEAVMRSLALYFKNQKSQPKADQPRAENIKNTDKISNIDENKWGIVGLLHDGDYEETKNDPSLHTIKMAQWLKGLGETDEEILEAILSHNFAHTGNNSPKNNLEWSLYCCDELTGLIVAVALVRPEKKLSTVTVESVMKKWNIKQFAAGAKREQIAQCEEKLGIKLADFIQIALSAMQGISSEIGL